MSGEDIGFEEVSHPITRVRVRFITNNAAYASFWVVQYKRKPKFYFDKWLWFTHSTHLVFADALARGETLAADGCVTEYRRKTVEFVVKE